MKKRPGKVAVVAVSKGTGRSRNASGSRREAAIRADDLQARRLARGLHRCECRRRRVAREAAGLPVAPHRRTGGRNGRRHAALGLRRGWGAGRKAVARRAARLAGSRVDRPAHRAVARAARAPLLRRALMSPRNRSRPRPSGVDGESGIAAIHGGSPGSPDAALSSRRDPRRKSEPPSTHPRGGAGRKVGLLARQSAIRDVGKPPPSKGYVLSREAKGPHEEASHRAVRRHSSGWLHREGHRQEGSRAARPPRGPSSPRRSRMPAAEATPDAERRRRAPPRPRRTGASTGRTWMRPTST